MTLLTVQTVCTTFLSHDGMILGNVGISPRPSSCLTRNNAQRRFGFDRISSIAQRCDLPVFSPLDLLTKGQKISKVNYGVINEQN